MSARIDKMLAAGRISEDEAARVRSAAETGDLDAVLQEIRLRHARQSVATAVAEGRKTQEDAAALLERLDRGEEPRGLLRGRSRRGRS